MVPDRLHQRWLAAAAAIATGVLLASAGPPFGLWPLVFIGFAPLLLALRGRGAVGRARLAALSGATIAVVAAVGPAGLAASRFLDVPLWQGLAILLPIGILFGGISFGLFGWLAGDPEQQSGAGGVVRAASAFAVAEWLRGHLLTGVPWLLLAHALAPRPELAQLAAWGGSGLVAAWIVAVNAGLAGLLSNATRRGAAVSLALLVALAGAAAFHMPGRTGPGGAAPSSAAAAPSGALRFALVQPALPAAVWNDGARAPEALQHMVDLSLREAGAPVDLVVWPESALKLLLPANRDLVRRAAERLAPAGRHLLLGAPRYDPDAPERRWNSVHLVDAAGRTLGVHDKVRLVPFFEYRPFGIGSAGALLTPGRAPIPLPLGETRLGVLVCYELLFSHLARAAVADGAGVLLNLSNDAWFAGTGGAAQHFAAAVLLAIEVRRPLLRSTPTGITGAIDAAGRVAAQLPPETAGVLRVDVWPARGTSAAARAGDGPVALALALSVAFLVGDLRRRRGMVSAP